MYETEVQTLCRCGKPATWASVQFTRVTTYEDTTDVEETYELDDEGGLGALIEPPNYGETENEEIDEEVLDETTQYLCDDCEAE
jgi:hypothetical protein